MSSTSSFTILWIPQERVQITWSVFSLKCHTLRFIQLRTKSNSKKLIFNWLNAFLCLVENECYFALSVREGPFKHLPTSVLQSKSVWCCLTSACWVIVHAFLSSAIFFFNFKKKNMIRVTVFIKIRPDILSALIWTQSVCKGYQ